VAAANRLRHCLILLLFLVTAPGAGLVFAQDPTPIQSLSSIGTSGNYIITQDIVASSSFNTIESFSGTLEAGIDPDTHMPYRIKNLSKPLFTTLTGTVKNLVLEDVSISGNTGNTGAIAGTANSAARIYNVGILSGSVGGSGNTGGLVGLLEGTARVINCYSFATITGGTNVGGIVGNNNATTTAASINTMVMNCMFYGDITGGSTVSPVFGGTNIANLQGGLNTFNYYAYDKLKTKAITNNKYNSALAVEEKFLNRFEFYRLLLNSNKKLAAFYATGSVNNGSQMLKWVLETADRTIDSPKPYPILKEQDYYPSIINPDFAHAEQLTLTDGKPLEEDRNKGGKLGTLSVTISSVGSNAPSGAKITTNSLTLTRTDKDFDRFNYNYDKVQLPYYNDVGTGNYTGNRVVTGWKITAITTVANDSYTSANYDYTKTYASNQAYFDYPNYNFADRRSSNKDLYSVSGRVFSQGAYFDVPYGVTSITIEPYWGNAIYVADQYYDVVYKNDYSGKQGVSQTGTQAVDNTTTFNSQKIRTSITGLGSGTTVYDNAVVLVGNFHLDGVPSSGTTPFTIMSVDLDNDHEPDYSLTYHHKGRLNVCPIRFDFLNVPGTSQAQRPNSASLACNVSIFKTRGWFEITNTSLLYFSQFEYENLGNSDGSNNSGKANAPLILQGGIFDQFVSTQSSDVNGRVTYIHLGGNVWIKEFGMGTHSDGNKSTPHVPVSVTGGEFPGFYLTGTYNQDAGERTDNAECYISGGYFVEMAGASQEPINGNVRWQIYNADIDNFFGGGINAARPIKGNVTIDIYNSHVTTYCGGPKFGDMQSGKVVRTTAQGCVFTNYFGAGFGGTSYSRKKYYDEQNYNFDSWDNQYVSDRGKYFDGVTTNAVKEQYGKKGLGVATDFDYEFFIWSKGNTGGRFFVKFASFSLAQCNDVESNLKNCTITNNYYGGGSLGKVVGTINSELDNCTVKGNVFGAGFSASLPKLYVRNAGFTSLPKYNSGSGMFEPGIFSGTTEFEWKNATEAGVNLTNNKSGSDLTNHYIYTNIDLSKSNLGSVAGNVNLTIKGNSEIGTTGDTNTGNVFGGGESSYVTGADHTVTVNLQGNAHVLGNVFGGGHEGVVECNSVVNIEKDNDNTAATGVTVNGSVFGGGNAASVGKTGQSTSATVNITGADATVDKQVYGGCNSEGSVIGKATVNITAGTIGTADGQEIKNVVFGGGKGLSTLIEGDVEVNIGTTNQATGGATINGSVYGGSALGNVNATKSGNVLTAVTGSKTDVNINCGTVDGDVYGGGLGDTLSLGDDHSNVAANVYGTVTVNIGSGTVDGEYGNATITGSVYGCNNINGTPQGDVHVNVYQTAHTAANQAGYTVNDGTNGNPTYAIDQVFGGGNKANYSPSESTNKVQVHIYSCNNTVNTVYGGGNAANATNVGVIIDGGRFYRIFGGGNGYSESGNHDDPDGEDYNPGANITGSAITRIHGGRYYQVFGGSNQFGDVANASLSLDSDSGCDLEVEESFGGANEAVISGNIVTTLSCSDNTIHVGSFYGGSNKADITGNVILNVEGGTYTNVFGGSKGVADNPADIYGDVTLNLYGGTIENAFGGSDVNGNITGRITVNMLDKGGDCGLMVNNIYGGGRDASYTPTTPGAYPEVNLIHGTVSKKADGTGGNVFGGGKGTGAVVTSNPVVYIGYDATMATRLDGILTGITTLTNATVVVAGNVYGGGDQATVTGNTSVYVQQHTAQGFTSGTTVSGDVYGGGNQADVTGAVSVLVSGGTVTHDVYGGGALANTNTVQVNTGTEESPVMVSPSTTVTVTGGTIHDVYGGGLGRIAVADNPETTDVDETVAAVAALVNGAVTVNINGGTITDVFGANNYNGAPQSTVKVIVEQTAASMAVTNVFGGGNLAQYAGSPQVKINNGTVGNVYGGGNGDPADNTQLKGATAAPVVTVGDLTADHEAYIATVTGDVYGGGNAAKVTGNAAPTVLIQKCNTQAGYVYGGGNAADVPETNVNISGGTINEVYGGGHGDNTQGSEKRANVTGNVNVTIAGGTIASVFAGSNLNGAIGGTVSLNINKAADACDMKIGEVYGGGNQAAGNAGTITIGCTGDWTTAGEKNHTNANFTDNRIGYELEGIGTVYGGANQANVGNDITLLITGGIVENVFGGNNTSGNIDGDITVNVEWNNAGCDNYLGYVYGGGNLATYSQKTEGHPTVNIKNGTVSHNVYGGGKGLSTDHTKGQVNGNPRVIIGDITSGHESYQAVVSGDVYGGGDAGNVTGNPVVTLQKSNTVVANAYGGGNAADITGNSSVNITDGTAGNLFGGGKAASVTGQSSTTTVNITGGTVTNGVYGGCDSDGSVSTVTVNLNGGTVGAAGDGNSANVFGGGFGASTTTTGNIDVNLNGATVYGDIYGGSALGSVNSTTTTNTTTLTISSNTLHGKVFGGGEGSNDGSGTTATSNGNVIINYNTANDNLDGIYGGANINGLVSGNIELNIRDNIGTDGNRIDVFGGGLGAATATGGNITVNMGDIDNTYQPIIYGDVYGGSEFGTVNDAESDLTTVNILSGTLHGNTYGGGLGEANVMDGTTIVTDNSAKGQVNGTVIVNIGTGTVDTTTGFATSTTGYATIDGSIYGCNNTNGSPKGNVTVNVYKTAHVDPKSEASYTGNDATYDIDQVFGGGKQADYSPVLDGGTTSTKRATVHVYGCDNTIEDLFGGGDAAAAYGVVTIVDGGRFNRVFGGGNGEVTAADIGAGGTNLQTHGGKIFNLFGGSNTSGTITGDMGISVDATGDCAQDMYVDEFFCGNNRANIGTADHPVNINATIGCGTRFGDIYGGCNLADIYGNVTLTIVGGEMNNVYGGSKGNNDSNPQAANITGNTTLNIYGGNIRNDAFGGSNKNGNITGTITVNMDWSLAAADCNNESNLHVGNIYGASNLAAYNPTTPGASPSVNIMHGTVTNSVYGGGKGASAVVESNPLVTIGDNEPEHAAIVTENVYGGGDAAAVIGNTSVIYNDQNTLSTVTKLFGGGNEAGVSGTSAVTLDNGKVTAGIYGGCNTSGSVGNVTVTLNGGTVGAAGQGNGADVFGGGYGSATTTTGNIDETVNGATIYGDVYGGSALGSVNASGSNTTAVTLTTGTIHGNIYGGGLGSTDVAALVNGAVTVTVNGGSVSNVFGANNVNGAPQSTVTVNIADGNTDNVYGGGNLAAYGTAMNPGTPAITMTGGTAANVFGGGLGQTAAVTGNPSVTIEGGTVTGNVYGGGSLAQVNGSTTVTVQGTGKVNGDLYGGGSEADVTQNVNVSITGGRVLNDVYGGGALASTNTDNWNAGSATETYYTVSGLIVGTSPVDGLYTKTGENTYMQASGTAQADTWYYRKVSGDWADGMNTAGSTTYKTTLNLTGGIIGHNLVGKGTDVSPYTPDDYLGGNVYGGGLGRVAHGDVSAVEAMVYGDVDVTVNGTAFIQRFVNPPVSADPKVSNAAVPFSGRVFGCNNLNGTPKGNVTVTVLQTIPVDASGNIASLHDENRFEIHSVYGGGNLASYMPADGKGTKVIIDGCGNTIIEKVFGGGNSASVPSTNVVILGSLYIGYAFGGGNGADRVYKPWNAQNSRWELNDGAPIYGNASIIAVGGKIGQVFSGSDTKGTVYGNATVKLKGKEGEEGNVGGYTSDCPLKITNTYGAGRGADINGDVNLIVNGCTENDAIERVFGGSFDANIRGDVNLTITSGIFAQVFGGNDHGGSIGGNINVNIEETDDCNPTIIQNLYGGGREAAYPGVGAHNKAGHDVSNGNITVNVKSATRIDNVYGGSYRAQVDGNTEVNINMIKGSWVNKPISFPDTYRGDQIPNVRNYESQYREVTVTMPDPANNIPGSSVNGYYTKSVDSETGQDIYTKIQDIEAKAQTGVTYYQLWMTGTVTDDIGTIGNVFGGSYESTINGNSTVNIGTQTSTTILKRSQDGTILATDGQSIYDGEGKMREGITIDTENKVVLGAHITGNVFGGGDNATVTGNTTVNISAKDGGTGYTAVTPGASGVTIQGTVHHGVFGGGNMGVVEGSSYVYLGAGSVNQNLYGGGCEADVKGNTYVTMLGGYVYDGVYGGGLMGSVGTFTRDNTGHTQHDGCVGGKPDTWTAGTGKCTVLISGGRVGPVEAALAGRGMNDSEGIVDYGFVFGAGRGEVENPAVDKDADFHTYVYETDVTISGGLIMASVYGGGENGRVRGNTLVKIEGGQIGCGEVSDAAQVQSYPESAFIDPTTTMVTDGDALAETSHWPYGYEKTVGGNTTTVYEPYDPYADQFPTLYATASTAHPSDGKTYYGSVFGGGSGYFPYEIRNSSGQLTGYDWLASAGMVEGNTEVRITGGHILTNVYGGNELTDVLGSCTVTMSGGTIGVPRTLAQIAAHPVTCYLFGGGKGDPRVHLSKMNHVGNVYVTVNGGIIYGSVFGGAEDGQVQGDVTVDITDDAKIGTWGSSYVDGNVFGGGRGFSGEALLAGNVNGNITVNITGGTMLGSIYGGGRLGSVGYDSDGLMQADKGHVTVNISGGTIGNDYEFKYYAPNAVVNAQTLATDHNPNVTLGEENVILHTRGGNVFAGGMGRREKLDGNTATDWKRLGNVNSTKLTISGNSTVIKGNVYGGGEYGAVTGSHTTGGRNLGTEIIINGGTIGSGITNGTTTMNYYGRVFGGGMGNPRYGGGDVLTNTSVTITDGKIKGTVYGGGEIASVGKYTYETVSGYTDDPYITDGPVSKPTGLAEGYTDYGHTYVTVSGGEIGPDGMKMNNTLTGRPDDYGHVFGGGMGEIGDTLQPGLAYLPYMAFADNTHVNISGNAFVKGSVYGGSENGHVLHDTHVTISGGQIGQGKSIKTHYTDDIWSASYAPTDEVDLQCESWPYGETVGTNTIYTVYDKYASTVTGQEEKYQDGSSTEGGRRKASDGHTFYGNVFGGGSGYYPYAPGKWLNSAGAVYGNTYVTVTGGHILTNLYGGNEMTNVGDGDLRTTTDGKSIIRFGGTATLGVPRTNSQIAAHPVICYLFGAGKGDQRIFFNKETNVEDVDIQITGGWIYGSVLGGGEDGHVLRNVSLSISDPAETGKIATRIGSTGTSYFDGNVFGGGRGFSGDALTAGNVGGCIDLNISGGTILGSVYGGGRLASVGYGLYLTTESGYGVMKDDGYDDNNNAVEGFKRGYINIDISGGTIGNDAVSDYSGNVFGASMGRLTHLDGTSTNELWPKLAAVKSTRVTISGNTTLIKNNVYGGGEYGSVSGYVSGGKRLGTEVIISGGNIQGSVFGGGYGSDDDTKTTTYGDVVYKPTQDAGKVYGNTLVRMTATGNSTVQKDVYGGGALASVSEGTDTELELLGGRIMGDAYGGGLGQLGSNPVAPTVGNVTVKLGQAPTNGLYPTDANATAFKPVHHTLETTELATGVDNTQEYNVWTAGRIFGGNNLNGTPKGNVQVNVYLTRLRDEQGNTVSKHEKHDGIDPATNSYELAGVYGGGNLATYDPTNPETQTQVNIYGCDYTSIYQVYGGGNAASVPASKVTVEGTYEIQDVFGGGNGNDLISLDGVTWQTNPGADVGIKPYTGTGQPSAELEYAHPEQHPEGTFVKYADNSSSESVIGTASVTVRGGYIHRVFGGSNTKGDIIKSTNVSIGDDKIDPEQPCELNVTETYGGSNNAYLSGETNMDLLCTEGADYIYGGSNNAIVQKDVVLNINSGYYKGVFGGNNKAGAVLGSITINIEEKGCLPIEIDELYGGGYDDPYSVYGYVKDNNNNVVLDADNHPTPLTSGEQLYRDPVINIISATRIGSVFGGGYGQSATLVGNPHVNINMTNGTIDGKYRFKNGQSNARYDETGATYYYKELDGTTPLVLSSTQANPFTTKQLAIGKIGNVFGGGNNAKLIGNTYVEIGTGTQWDGERLTPARNAAIITGDVFGGGNNADVTGNTNITIGDEDNDTELYIANRNLIIQHNVYGGGNMGSVGTITNYDDLDKMEDGEYLYRHDDLNTEFGLSWPYKLVYAQGTGKTTVNIYGGRIGLSGKDWFGSYGTDQNNAQYRLREDNGDVYGGSKGRAGGKEGEDANRYNEARIANVRETEVNINLPTPANTDYQDIGILASYDYDDEDLSYKMKYSLKLKDGYSGIAGSVYGGGEDGHVYEDTYVNINGGYIGHGVYGGGKGKGTYQTTLKKLENEAVTYNANIYSWTAGRVYGNTHVTMTNGYVMRSIYGGGNLGSVGIGNYASGTDDYYPNGYGEKLATELWSNNNDNSRAFMSSGITNVSITGGRVGFMPDYNTPIEYTSYTTHANGNTLGDNTANANDYYKLLKKIIYKDDLPTGNVFGGSRGTTAPDVGKLSPRYEFVPEFYLGYVNETNVVIGGTGTGPTLLGSVYGGGQDGHVRRDTKVNIVKGKIGIEYSIANRKLVGTLAYSAADGDAATSDHTDITDDQWLHRGNVYGAGSGIGKYKYDGNDDGDYNDEIQISSSNKTIGETGYGSSAGSVSRFTTVNVGAGINGQDGIIYRHVYGGGSLSSIGPAKIFQTYDPYLPSDTEHSAEYGRQTLNLVNIEGTVGHAASYAAGGYGGDVNGGSRGDITLDANTFATSFYTQVNIKNKAHVIGNVFGGGEAGIVKNDTYVNIATSPNTTIASATIGHDVFGGGYVADVQGNTNVNIGGGHIKHNVYGGGNEGSVGTWDVKAKHDYVNATDAKGAVHDFGLSWPYELEFKEGTGLAKIRIYGQARIGLDGDDDGDVFGASKGKAADRYTEALLYNVRNSDIEIDLPSFTGQGLEPTTLSIDDIISVENIQDSETGEFEPKLYIDDAVPAIAGSVYGGGEDGHVYGNTNLTLKSGLVGHSIYGGGKGKGQYNGQLRDYHNRQNGVGDWYNAQVYSLVAGRVYGNTNVTMEDGYVMRSIYGGGNLGSVGIGNYAGGSDDYSTDGYGELPPESDPSLWTNTDFLESGIATIRIESGTVGYICKENSNLNKKSGLPTGNVFGGCRGMSAPNYNDISPRYEYFPEFFFGYVNDARVIIGTDSGGPTILGSVYGGGQDGHVRRDAVVTINNGIIGTEYNDNNKLYLGTEDLNHMQWRGRGNVYAAGSGTGEFEHTWTDSGSTEHTETGYNYSSGSVTGVAKVQIYNGTVYQNVYGGGSLASIGPPPVPPARVYPENKAVEVVDPVTNEITFESADKTQRVSYTGSFVTVSGGQVGQSTNYAARYGGNVYGASRGDYDGSLHLSDPSRYASTVWTRVVINGNAHILGNVFGGGEAGSVKRDTFVEIGGVALPQPITNHAPAQGGGSQGASQRQDQPQSNASQPTATSSGQTNAATESQRTNSVNFRRE